MSIEHKFTIGELAEWILDNRGNSNAFKNDDLGVLCRGIEQDIKNENMLHVVDEDSGIIGIITFMKDHSNKLIFVKNILVTRHSALVVFIQYFKMKYGGYSIAANRNDEYVMYNTNRMIHLLEKKVRVK